EVIAPHVAIGASTGDIEAIEWLRRAGRRVAARAPSVAADFLRRALELSDPADPVTAEIGAELAVSLALAGQPAEALARAHDALALARDPATVGLLRWVLGSASAVLGRLTDALHYTELAAREEGLPPGRRARLLADVSQWRFYTGDVDEAETAARSAVAEGRRSGDEIAVGLGMSALSRVAMERGDLDEAIAQGYEALQTVSGSPLETQETEWIHPSFDLGGTLVVADRMEEARHVLRTGRRFREQLGSTWDLPLYTNTLAYAHLYAGEWDDAVAEAQTALALVAEGGAGGSAMWALSLLAYVALHREGVEATNDLIKRANALIQETGPLMGFDQILWCSALVHEIQGDSDLAWKAIDEAWNLRAPFKIVTRPRMAPDGVRLARAAGQEEEGRALISHIEHLGERTGIAFYQGIALRARALMEGDVEVALRAVETLRRCSRPVELAFACEDAGAALVSRGRAEEAEPLLHQAIATYEGIGARRAINRAEAVLRAAGRHLGRRGPRPKETLGWGSLTRSERDVVELVARGLTNREVGTRLFISRRTVETHLSHAFRKLGVSSRVELAAKAAQLSAGVPANASGT
ncbi:MAG TPA: LuxR C-terminal-related transcriptional regulator, partial [Actinomycetota bacterium]|nr:LuxR C-terminal-related transcriptional regulator [Actinomycetota bacterium]